MLAGIAISAYKYQQAVKEVKANRDQLGSAHNDVARKETLTKAVRVSEDKKNKQLMGIVKNSVDAIIPAARLGWLPVSDGTVGIAGTITSVIGIMDTWPGSK